MILAIDTATRWLGIGLHDGTAVLAETGWRCRNNHTIELTPSIQALLARTQTTPADLSGIAVAIGPGSYTGLRVGLAVAKGMALAHQTPLLGVMTLDIVAAAMGPQPGQLVVTAEAGRTRVCAAVYQWQDEQWQVQTPPDIFTWSELLQSLDAPTLFAGEISAAARKQIQSAEQPFRIAAGFESVRRAGVLAELGWRQLRSGRTDTAQSLVPVYLRDPAGAKPAA